MTGSTAAGSTGTVVVVVVVVGIVAGWERINLPVSTGASESRAMLKRRIDSLARVSNTGPAAVAPKCRP